MNALIALYPKDAPASTVRLREGQCPVAGRDAECDIRLSDPRVSARHARFLWKGKGFWLRDLDSRAGTYVNGLKVWERELRSSDWISFGGFAAQYIQVSGDAAGIDPPPPKRHREDASGAHAVPSANGLLARLVRAALHVAGSERGFVLVSTPGGMLFANAGRSGTGVEGRRAVEQVLEAGRPSVLDDARVEMFRTAGSGVAPRGLPGPVACVPLRDGERIVGVLSVEGRCAGVGFSDLEMQILKALADRAVGLLAGPPYGVVLGPLEVPVASGTLVPA